MKLVRASDLFDEAKKLLEGCDSEGRPHPRDIPRAEELLNELLSNNVGNPTVLYVLGSLHLTKGNFGLAIQLMAAAVKQAPNLGEAWNNLGLAFKEIGDRDRSVECAANAASLLGHPDIWSNLAGCYVNRGMPDKVLEPAEQALKLNPNHVKAQWHKALALLEMGKWGEAWDWHESRLRGGGQENIAERNYHEAPQMTPWWDGETTRRPDGKPVVVAVHGEQGMGDEIMFATCMRDVAATGVSFVFEPSPRLEELMRRSMPKDYSSGYAVYGTNDTDGRRWIEAFGRPDFKIPLGSLPKFFRRKAEDFPGAPYLIPDPDRAAHYKARLDALGKGLKVGLAWQGGVQSTFVSTRSFHPLSFGPVLKLPGVHFVSLQYDWTARENVADVERDMGVTIHHWPEAVEALNPETGKPSDLDELAALVSQLDLVITVPQTAYHVSGALGVPTWVLTPSEPDWRLGVEGDTNPWYSSVKLIRQKRGETWAPAIKEAARRLAEMVGTSDMGGCPACGSGAAEEHAGHCPTRSVA